MSGLLQLSGSFPDLFECLGARFSFLFGFGDDVRNIFGEGVHLGIRVTPGIYEFFGIEVADECRDFRKFEEARAGWNQ